MQVFLFLVCAAKVCQVGVIVDVGELVPIDAFAVNGREHTRDRNGRARRNRRDSVKEGLGDSACNNRGKEYPDGEGLERTALVLANEVDDKAVQQEPVIYNGINPEVSTGIDIVCGNIKYNRDEIVEYNKDQP